jgi:TetR/AcrR family transcriptional regulator, cholesterol catabolism regulator
MDTQAKIIEGAAKMFMRYGVRAVSMDEIAGKLGMSKKTLYQYYDDKDSLVEAAIKWDIEFDQQECLLCFNKSKNAIDEVFSVIMMMAEQMGEINPLVLYEMEKFYPNAYSHFKSHKNSFIYKTIENNLVRGIEEGLFREDINVEVITKFRVESIMLLFNPDAFPINKKYSINDLMLIITEHYLYGIATAKGIKLIQKHITEINKQK